MPDLYRVPGAQPRFLGVGQYGGEPLAVVDVLGLERETEGVGGTRGIMVVIAPGDELLIGLAADDAEYVTRLADRSAERRTDGPIWTADDDGVKRLEPSWFLARADGVLDGTGPEDS
jgi:chemotaxis signal transduction protein